jgi:hypothetical protein
MLEAWKTPSPASTTEPVVALKDGRQHSPLAPGFFCWMFGKDSQLCRR